MNASVIVGALGFSRFTNFRLWRTAVLMQARWGVSTALRRGFVCLSACVAALCRAWYIYMAFTMWPQDYGEKLEATT
ncbi:hypothetical protein HDN1F_30380 [gamma proteobacterium HdN1]|nr:hypothetical protein HDN1F_30380 [gamma proteobacterium HdN1]